MLFAEFVVRLYYGQHISVCVCVCVCACMRACVFVYVCKHGNTYVCMYAYIYVWMYVYVYVCVYIYIYMCVCVCVCVCVCMYIRMFVCMYFFLFVSTLQSSNSPRQHILTHRFLPINKNNNTQDMVHMYDCLQYTHFPNAPFTIVRAPNNKTVLIRSNQIWKSIKFASRNVTGLLPNVIVAST